MPTYITRQRQVKDLDTGEVFVLEETHKTAFGKKSFWKLYLSDFLPLLGLVMDNQQLNVLIYILENTRPSDNIFIGSFRKVAEDIKVSLATVYRIMRKLQATKYKNNFMVKKVQSGVYMISPDLIVQGGDKKKRSLMITWEQLGDKTVEDFGVSTEEYTTVKL